MGAIEDIIGMRLNNVVQLIRGAKGTLVRLQILPKDRGPEGPYELVSLVRDKIRLEQRAATSYTVRPPGTDHLIGVIDLPSFYADFAAIARGDRNYRSTTRDVRRLIEQLRALRVDGLVIDLRGNGGGSLQEALELTGLFIRSGPIVQTRSADGRIDVNTDPDPELFYGAPLAVLVDRYSASASEIFAGAIQDYRRGVILGEPTFGKGTVQNITDLNRFAGHTGNDLGRVKTTIAQFYRVSGGSNQYLGVQPDIAFPAGNDLSKSGERAYDNALPWDEIRAVQQLPPASTYMPLYQQLRSRHSLRLQQDEDFQQFMKTLEYGRKNSERLFISLNEDTRKRERDELMAIQNIKPEEAQQEKEEASQEAAVEEVVNGRPKMWDELDVLMRESTFILNDLIDFSLQKQQSVAQPSSF